MIDEVKRRTHPALVHFPLALYPVSLLFLALGWVIRDPFFWAASYWAFVLGVLFTLPVALTGWWDMIRLRNAKGNKHLRLHVINGTALTVLSLVAAFILIPNPFMAQQNLLLFYTLTLALLTGLVMFQGLLGATMVYQSKIGIDGETR
jgi:uncharacterized membrane protein